MAGNLVVKPVAADVPAILLTLALHEVLSVAADAICPVRNTDGAGDNVVVFVATNIFVFAPVLFTLLFAELSQPLVVACQVLESLPAGRSRYCLLEGEARC